MRLTALFGIFLLISGNVFANNRFEGQFQGTGNTVDKKVGDCLEQIVIELQKLREEIHSK